MRIGDLGGGEAVGGARGCPRDPAPVARFMVFAVGGRNAGQDALSEVLASPFFLGGVGGNCSWGEVRVLSASLMNRSCVPARAVGLAVSWALVAAGAPL